MSRTHERKRVQNSAGQRRQAREKNARVALNIRVHQIHRPAGLSMESHDDPSPWRSVRAGPDRSIDIPCKYPDKGPMLYEVRKGVQAKARGGREGTLALLRPRWQPAPARRILPQFNRMLTCAPVLASRRFWNSAPTSRVRQERPSLLVRCNACRFRGFFCRSPLGRPPRLRRSGFPPRRSRPCEGTRTSFPAHGTQQRPS